MRFCQVYLLDTSLAYDKAYTYSVPETLSDASVGRLAVVPFGKNNRKRSAFIVRTWTEEGEKSGVKPILALPDYDFAATEETVSLATFIRDRCFCTYGAALKLLLPVGINTKTAVYYTALASDCDDEVYFFVRDKEKVYEKDIVASFGKDGLTVAAALCRRGALAKHSEVAEHTNTKTEAWVRLVKSDGNVKGEKQKLLLKILSEGDAGMTQLSASGVSPATVRNMEEKGYVSIYRKRVQRLPYATDGYAESAFTLSEKQSAVRDSVLEYMRSGKAEACLLHGVTGSGKTKIILSAVDEALSQGRSAIVLMPEIGLTAQAVSTYFARYGESCAVLHSKLSEGEKADAYLRIKDGTVKVVIGTRSAVFAPLADIGVIVLDEEQEHTYKSEKTPKYHAKDIARFRCARHGALMLLASATPSVESYYRARMGIYHLLTLDERYGGTELPYVEIVNVVGDERIDTGKLIGTELKEALEETIAAGEQAILFLGRRGYNSALRCRSCGHVFTCDRCSVSLNYHAYSSDPARRDRLVCHYCGRTADKPTKCPECGGSHIGYFGFGTQLLQDELEELFGEGCALRMDTDTTTAKRSHDEILDEFGRGDADILYGTQMVVKGLDFPRVSLVGLVMADSVLYMSDFRAPERMFSLITQLVGRAGRSSKRGRALIQTYNPNHQTLRLGAKQDYVAFYESEIKLRRAVLFPPFCDIAVFSFSSEHETAVTETANRFSVDFEAAAEKQKDLKLIKMGPYREGIYKIGGRYRNKIIVKYKDSKECRALFRSMIEKYSVPAKDGATTDIDINPFTV